MPCAARAAAQGKPAAESVITVRTPASRSENSFFPREHGATAMLLLPFLCAAILLRQVRQTEAVALVAVVFAFALKDPLIVLARQRWIWKQPHPETKAARRWVTVELLVLAACGVLLLWSGPRLAYLLLGLGAAAFTVLAVAINVHNRQRAEWFQSASAAVLTATSLVACLSVLGTIPRWCWLLWLLNALQAAANIFVVHSRLDARIALRKNEAVPAANRRAAMASVAALLLAAALFAMWQRPWIAAALLVAAAGYAFELRRQKDPASLQMPLTRVGMQSLALAILYGSLVIVGLWPSTGTQ